MIIDMTIERVAHHIKTEIIPRHNIVGNHDAATGQNVRQRYASSPPSLTTVWRWIKLVGFRYDNEKKSFYIDGHEKPEQKFHRV